MRFFVICLYQAVIQNLLLDFSKYYLSKGIITKTYQKLINFNPF